MRKFFKIGLLFLLILVALLTDNLFAQNDLQTAFEKVKKGYETARFHAVVTDTVAIPFVRGRHHPAGRIRYRINKWEIWYAGPNKLRLERLNEKKSGRLIIVRNGEKLFTRFRHAWVARKILHKEGESFREFPIRLRGGPYFGLVNKNYNIQLTKNGKIANRQADLLSILPKYKRRIIWKIWLDDETGIILRQVQQIDTPWGLKIVRAKQVISIDYQTDFQDSLFTVSGEMVEKKEPFEHHGREHFDKKANLFRHLEDLVSAAPGAIYLPEPIPEGFSFIEGKLARRHHMTMTQMHFSDGLIDFSIFQIDAPEKMQKRFFKRFRRHRPPDGRRPPMEIIPFEKDGFAFLIMGNFPAPWLAKLARQMRPYSKNPNH